jgi:transcriptional regulator with XRE-family HTH domain
MKERLLKFLEEESLTASKFADDIGVQRSSISHILSGRNNPGYDFLQKVLKCYPYLNAEWLILGSGKMTKVPQQASLFAIENELNTVTNERAPLKDQLETSSTKKEHNPVANEPVLNLNQATKETSLTKRIEKIVILFSDQSFMEYLPSK